MRNICIFTFILFITLSCSTKITNIGRAPAQVNSSCSSSINKFIENPFQNLVSRVRSQVFKMGDQYKGEELGRVFPTKVTYLTQKGRKEYEVFVNREGQLINQSGEVLESPSDGFFKKPVEAIYVIDPKGKIYISYYKPQGVFHHSSFLSGGDVIAAGTIVFKNGHIKSISNSSGHYRVTDRSLEQVVELFEALNVKVDEIHFVGQ